MTPARNSGSESAIVYWFPPRQGYGFIFLLEALMVVLCYLTIRPVTVEGLKASAREISN
jgi:hypothetical protein